MKKAYLVAVLALSHEKLHPPIFVIQFPFLVCPLEVYIGRAIFICGKRSAVISPTNDVNILVLPQFLSVC